MCEIKTVEIKGIDKCGKEVTAIVATRSQCFYQMCRWDREGVTEISAPFDEIDALPPGVPVI